MTESTAERRVGPGLAERTAQAMVWRRGEVFDSQEGERARVAGAQRMRWGQGWQEWAAAGPHAGIWSLSREHWEAPTSVSSSANRLSFQLFLGWGVVEAQMRVPIQFPVSLEAQPGLRGPRTRAWGLSGMPGQREGHRLTSECVHS